MSLPPEIASHYRTGYEAGRLQTGTSQLEWVRTQEIVRRYLPPPPAVILDVGGGPGAYACWLAREGYEVHLIDALPLHVELARQASEKQPVHPIASCSVGDARRLDREDQSADAVLFFGPLYHLTERNDRLKALREAHRILRRGGLLLAVGISRFASTLDGLARRFLEDPQFARIVQQDIIDGQHRNPTNHPAYFTTAFFHKPEELRAEVEEAGFDYQTTLAVEGPAWLLQDFEQRWGDPRQREVLLKAIRTVESEASLLGASAHLMAVARRSL